MATTVTRVFRPLNADIDQKSLTADTTLDAGDTNTTIFLDAIGEAVLLPAPLAGLKYPFIVTEAIVTSSWTIAATGALIFGSVTEAGLVQLASAETTITIVFTKAIKGDWFTLEADGTSWYLKGQLSVAGSLTTA
jgi:hypothetical protein